MTTPTTTIEVAANTSLAVRAYVDLRDVIIEQTTAADASGEGQKTLAQRIAATKEQQLAATEAIQHAQRALAEHTKTVEVHGRESREAADSLARLKAAQAEATRQAQVADKAIADVAAETATAVREADKLTPALARAAREVRATAMQAERAAGDVRKMDLALVSAERASLASAAAARIAAASNANAAMEAYNAAQANRALSASAQKGGEDVSLLGSVARKVGPMFGGALLAGGIMAAAGSVREMSAEVVSFETAMSNLPFGLEEARLATKGFVNDAQLAKSAAQGLALGVIQTEGEFSELAEWATKLGIKLGIGPTQALENMMTALGRGSTEILDNLGVAMKATEAYDRYAKSVGKTADELTEAEKKVAFKVEAMKALKAAADDTTLQTDSAAAAVQRFGVSVDNAAKSAKGLAVEIAGGLIQAVEQLNHAMSSERVDERVEAGRAHVDEMRKLEAATRAQSAAQAEYVRSLNLGLRDMTEEERAAHDAIGKAAFDRANTLGTLDGELLKHWETVKGFTSSIWEQADAYAETTRRAREAAEADEVLWQKMLRRQDDKTKETLFERAMKPMGPDLPEGWVRVNVDKEAAKGRKARKDRNQQRLEQHEFDTEVDAFEFEVGKDVREKDKAAAEKAYEKDTAAGEAKLAVYDRELELLDAIAAAESVKVEAMGFTLEAETDAAEKRNALIDMRLDRELELARWQAKNATTEAERERASTRVLEVEQRKRVTSLERAVADEEKAMRRRQEVIGAVTGVVSQLSDVMVNGVEAMIAGEKGAIAGMLADLLKSIAKKNAILALEQAAMGAAAIASYNYPKGALHFAAAGLHTGVAAVAGVGAYAAGQVAEARAGGGGGGGASGFSPSPGVGVGRGGSPRGGSSGESSDGVEQQEVPISYEQLRRGDPSVRRGDERKAQPVYVSVFLDSKEMTKVVRRNDRVDQRGTWHRG